MEIENDQVQRKMCLMAYLFRIVLQIVDNKLQNANTTGKEAGIVCWEVKRDNKCPHIETKMFLSFRRSHNVEQLI